MLVKEGSDGDIKLVLADFGTATQFSDTLLVKTYAGTPLYMAPEIGGTRNVDGKMKWRRYDGHLADGKLASLGASDAEM